jgi:hypothetical protein
LASFRAEAAAELAAVRADLGARAERAEAQAAYRAELAQLREHTGHHGGTAAARPDEGKPEAPA